MITARSNPELRERIEEWLATNWGDDSVYASSLATLALVVDAECERHDKLLGIPLASDARVLVAMTIGAWLCMKHPGAMWAYLHDHARLLPRDEDMCARLDRVQELAEKMRS